jgi:hypothetical protein
MLLRQPEPKKLEPYLGLVLVDLLHQITAGKLPQGKSLGAITGRESKETSGLLKGFM